MHVSVLDSHHPRGPTHDPGTLPDSPCGRSETVQPEGAGSDWAA